MTRIIIIVAAILFFPIKVKALERVSACGKSAMVSPAHAHKFQGFLTELCNSGYKIQFIGGWRRHGSCRGCDMHPRGMAIDINQTARNRVTKRFPSNITSMASRHGLLHGSVWSNPDAGHFEVSGVKNYSRKTRSKIPARTMTAENHDNVSPTYY